MNILYINDELATTDGSNYHAIGILNSLKKQLGIEHIRSYPQPIDGSGISTNHSVLHYKEKHKLFFQLLRFVGKAFLSLTRAHSICKKLKAEGWTPTHILARSVIFDITAIYVAKHFHAKLIYEVNAPLYHEQCLINGLPLSFAVKRWEQNILAKSDLIYTISNTCRDMLLTQYNCHETLFHVIPNGYMEELYMLPKQEQKELRAQIRSQEHFDGKFIITFIGSLKKWHGISLLCQLAAAFEANTNFHFLIIGNGSERHTISQYCNNHSNMTHVGKLDLTTLSKYLFASDLGIMPYDETKQFYFSPLKMYDMIGAELPFIGTNQGQIREAALSFLDESFLIQDLSPEGMRAQIQTLANDKICYERMKLLLSKAKKEASWDHRTAQLLEALKKL